MNKLKIAIVVVGLLSAGKASAQVDHINTISIFKSYSSDIPVSLKARLDSTILATTERFNINNDSFKIRENDSSATQKIALDITKAKLATKKQRYVAYLVNLIVPIYVPMHKIKSSVTLDEGTPARDNVRSVKSSTHILIGSIEKREDKMLQKYADKLLRELNAMTDHVRPEFASSLY